MADTFATPNFNLGSVEEVFGLETNENAGNDDGMEMLLTEAPINVASTSSATSVQASVQASVNLDPKSSRFLRMDEADIQGLIGESRSKATDRNTNWAVKLLKEWLQERNFNPNFEVESKGELNDKLRMFYAEVRNSNGGLYSKSTFVGLRAGINRHIRAPPFERDFNVMNDRDFTTSNNVFMSILRKLKKEGLDKTNHHSAISPTELKQIRESFDLNSPSGLQNKVWFDLTLGFARRGLENQRSFTPSTFRVASDEDGREFIEITHSELTKNHRGGVNDDVETHKRIYASGGKFCPVTSFKLYLGHLNPENECLYQQPKMKLSQGDMVWYTSRPIGVNTLSQIMKNISKNAKLDKIYTNHCLRATAVTLLSHAGVEAREICKITGHKNDQSLKSYSRESSTAQKRTYSAILQGDDVNISNPIPDTNARGVTALSLHKSENSTMGMFHISNSSVTINNYFAGK